MTIPTRHRNVEDCVDDILSIIGNDIRIGLPLGLGKPPELINALYQRAKADPNIKLMIATALSLEVPDPGTGLQKRFLGPFLQRVFGDYPGLDYMRDLRAGTVPDNIVIHEFFFKSGSMLGNDLAQQNYISTNYTHSVRDLLALGINMVAQLVSHQVVDGKDRYSMSCNPETTRDLLPELMRRKAAGEPILFVGQVNENLPFMGNDALIEEDTFDMVINNKEYYSSLFAPPNMPVSTVDHMIGLHASTLIADGGTLQIGIGSLGDAIVYGCELRQQQNDAYNAVLKDLQITTKFGDIIDRVGGTGTFEQGLYGNSEMFVDGFYYLIKTGILKRKVYDHEAIQSLLNSGRIQEQVSIATLDALVEAGAVGPLLSEEDVRFLTRFGIFLPGVTFQSGQLVTPQGQKVSPSIAESRQVIQDQCLGHTLQQGRIMHGGFFLGPRSFYEGLKNFSPDILDAINMTNISYVNQLYGNEPLKRLQRQKSRFINTVFLVHALGAATSDGLESGKVVSGVGGQYNFVAQAHELEDARSILMLKSTREKNGVTQSNIIWNYGHTTIPRHLRDIYVTEYGIADTRGKCDKDVIAALLNIADSRFQPELLAKAKQAGKMPKDYQIPEPFRHNRPETLEAALAPYRAKGMFPAFPCGTDFTTEELVVARCLKAMKAKTEHKSTLVKALLKALKNPEAPAEYLPYLERVQLDKPNNLEDRIARVLMMDELKEVLS
ncbi:acetyl-CoA hydrolase/transferase C-terminal domain-containing protein [Ketobacter sp.]|uniref:acetyl-CoA hydrolase/transferase C-terminal domain-containing protein n=1 Tax=Ketobacter sp. TaxID=2083498 RepID=UPI000F263F63|nr:acetyl-CoA hydrolase/transferase C-terminal domain-containing protein [Ketobacter sp.]RLT98065.1 MAG: acetyl-CoA hydrolase [Ketobacter sp.]